MLGKSLGAQLGRWVCPLTAVLMSRSSWERESKLAAMAVSAGLREIWGLQGLSWGVGAGPELPQVARSERWHPSLACEGTFEIAVLLCFLEEVRL